MYLSRRTLVGGLLSLPMVGPASALSAAARYSDRDYARAIVINSLGDASDQYGKEGETRYSARGAAELRQSGATAFNYTINAVGNTPDAADLTLGYISQVEQIIADNPDLLVRATSAADIRAAKATGKIAIFFGFQDTNVIGADLDRVALYRGLGIRIMQLTYNKRNLCGDGSLEPDNAGLSDLGRRMIEAIEGHQVLLDLSHGGQRTVAEAIEHAKRPPIISHSGCRALNDNPRNVRDEEMRALSGKGGVFGIYFMPFLTPNSKPTRDDLMRHIDHALNVCGEDHIAIGTDGTLGTYVIDDAARTAQREFYQSRKKMGIAAPGEGPDIFNYVADYNSPMRFRMLADDLSLRGWPGARIDKLLGGNLMRIYAEAWGA